MDDYLFGPPNKWPEQDLIAFSCREDEHLDACSALEAYRCGVFPMPLDWVDLDGIGWWSPLERGILPLNALKVRKSLRQSIRHYTTSIDTCFGDVMERCADPDRPGGWIDEGVRTAYQQLHEEGVAHSVETWDAQGRLVGGLYGVSIGGLFAGESMFHDKEFGRDASKVALVRLCVELAGGGCELLDTQWVTPHLATLGAITISRNEYLKLLDDVLERPGMSWERGGTIEGAALLGRL